MIESTEFSLIEFALPDHSFDCQHFDSLQQPELIKEICLQNRSFYSTVYLPQKISWVSSLMKNDLQQFHCITLGLYDEL